MSVTYRELRAGEWGEIPDEAWETSRSRPAKEYTRLLAAIAGGRVIGCIGGEHVVMVRPFWVEKEYRGQGIAAELARRAYEMQPEGVGKVMVTLNRHAEMLALKMGFDPLQGSLWLKDE